MLLQHLGLIHLHEAAVYFLPIGNSGGDVVKDRRVFVKGTSFQSADVLNGGQEEIALSVARNGSRLQDIRGLHLTWT